MSIVKTDLRVTRERAAQLRYYPSSGITATNVQDAIDETAVLAANPTVPPSITPTLVNFAMSPYTILPTDYLLLVDTSGGAITLNAGLAALRSKRDVVVKDDSGNAAANPITINSTLPDTIDGANSYVIDSNRQVYRLTPKTGGYTVTT